MKTLLAEIDHNKLAKHFGCSRQNMDQLKKRWLAGLKSNWEIYVKAYLFDKSRECKEDGS